MSTLTLYLQNAAAAYTPSTVRGAWDAIGEFHYVKAMGTSKSGALTSVGESVASTDADQDAIGMRFVSAPLAAETVFSGAYDLCVGMLESHADTNAYLHVHVFVLQGQTDNLRGTIVANAIDDTECGTAGATSGRGMSGTGTPVLALAGDTVVVEVGARCNADSASRTITTYYGGTGGGTLSDGGDGGTDTGWLALTYSAHTVTTPVVSVPVSGESMRSGAQTFTCKATDSAAAQIVYTWEIDTANPPNAANDDYATFASDPTASNTDADATHTFASGDEGKVWYCQVHGDAQTGTAASSTSTPQAFGVCEKLRLLPECRPGVRGLDIANKVFVVVKDSSPLVVGSATNTTVAPTYANSPRETVTFVGDGNESKCNTIAAAQLALRQVKRYNLTSLPVRLRDGLGILRGTKVRVVIPRAGIAASYPVRRIQHDFAAGITWLDVGDFAAPRDDTQAVAQVAKMIAQLEKEAAV